MGDKLVHKVNDANDEVANARAMVWAVFHIAQGMRQDELQDAITACCNQALAKLKTAGEMLDKLAEEERIKEGM
jgi:hypothetical protein